MWLTLMALRNGIAILMASLAIVVLGATSPGPDADRPLPQYQLSLDPHRHRLQGRQCAGHRADRHLSHREGGLRRLDVRHVESRSRQGISVVEVFFTWGSDLDAGLTEVVQRIQQIMNSLPAGVQQPFILKFDLSNIPVCLVTLSGGGLDEKQLYDLAYNTVEPQIERLSGVASANVDGGKIRQITVNLNRDLLYSKGISVTEVARAVNDSNFLLPSGDVKLGTLDYNVFTNNQFSVVDPMENIVVRHSAARPIHVRDLGRVEDSAETQQSIVRVNGDKAVYLRVNKQPGANTVGGRGRRQAHCSRTCSACPPGVKRQPHLRPVDLHPPVHPEPLARGGRSARSWPSSSSCSSCARSSSTIIISIAIPLSLLLTLMAMYLLGQTPQYLHARRARARRRPPRRRLHRGAREHQPAPQHPGQAAAPRGARRRPRSGHADLRLSTITTIVVFMPTVFLEGQAKLLFIPLTFTISCSLFASFLVSRTVTPLLASAPELERPNAPGARGAPCTPGVFAGARRILRRGSTSVYQRALELGARAPPPRPDIDRGDVRRQLVPRRRRTTSWPLIGTEFFPPSDESQFLIRVRARRWARGWRRPS